jgi:hypothetical protein
LVGEDEVARVLDPGTGEPFFTVNASGRKVGEASLALQGKRLFIRWDNPDFTYSGYPNLDLYDVPTGKLIKSYSIGYGRTHFSARRNFSVIPTAVNEDGDARGAMQLLDAATGEKIHDISFWHSDLRVRQVSEDGRRVFLTTDDKKPADDNSIVVDFEANRVLATLPTGIISDGGLYVNGRRAWTHSERGGGSVTIWDVEKQLKIVEIVGDIWSVGIDRSETLMFLLYRNGMLEGRDAVEGHLLFSTNARITHVKRAYFMNGRRTLALLIGDPPQTKEESHTLSISEIRLLDLSPNDTSRIAEAKRKVPRCLTPQQLEAHFLPKEPPCWCI